MTVPWTIRASVSMGGPSIWWLPRLDVNRRDPRPRRFYIHGGWLLWSFYVEVERLGVVA